MTPGELLTDGGEHALNPGRRTATVVTAGPARPARTLYVLLAPRQHKSKDTNRYQ